MGIKLEIHQMLLITHESQIDYPTLKIKKKCVSLFVCLYCHALLEYTRNNWVTEPSQTMEFVEPITQNVHQAKWKDLVQIYHHECNLIIKETKLSYAALYTTNFEKQKVQLACDIFNEKTVAALEKRNLVDTAIFVKMVIRMWNMINIKSPHAGYRTNDPDRNPFCDKSDERLVHIYVKLQQRLRGWITLPKVDECIVLLLIQATRCTKPYQVWLHLSSTNWMSDLNMSFLEMIKVIE